MTSDTGCKCGNKAGNASDVYSRINQQAFDHRRRFLMNYFARRDFYPNEAICDACFEKGLMACDLATSALIQKTQEIGKESNGI